MSKRTYHIEYDQRHEAYHVVEYDPRGDVFITVARVSTHAEAVRILAQWLKR